MIETARLVLRPWRPDDRAAFDALFNTSAMMARLGGCKPPEAMAEIFARRLNDYARHGLCYWAVIDRHEGVLVGSCGVRVADNYPGTPVADQYEAGWRIGEAYWRRGYALEAAVASIAWLWAKRPARAVFAWTTAANHASLGVMRALGMDRRPALDFIRPGSGDACLVHGMARP
jgi:RimJ/RimL family protein N-acetyltransferase